MKRCPHCNFENRANAKFCARCRSPLDAPSPSPASAARPNLLELYRAHRDEIDALTDPTTLFILSFVNHVGKISLAELGRDVPLSLSELRVKLVPLLRGKLIHDAKGTLTVTPLGAQLLRELGFPAQAAPASNQTRADARPAAKPRGVLQPAPARGLGLSALIGLAIIAGLFLIVGGGALVIALNPPATPTPIPTSTLVLNTIVPLVPSLTPTRTHTPSVTPSRTPTLTRTPTITRTPAPVTLNLNPIEDAFVTSVCSPTGVNNTDKLYVASNGGDPDCWGARQRALMRFDLKIPANAALLQAKLFAYVTSAAPGTTRIGVHRTTEAWAQSAVTWNTQPGRTAMYDNINVGGEGWYTWEVAKLVDEWHTGAQPNFGFALVNTNENVDTINFRAFASNEHVNRTLHPYLQITYQPR